MAEAKGQSLPNPSNTDPGSLGVFSNPTTPAGNALIASANDMKAQAAQMEARRARLESQKVELQAML